MSRPFLFAECLWAEYLQMLHDTFGIRSRSVDFSQDSGFPWSERLVCLSLQSQPPFCFWSLSVLPPELSLLLLPPCLGECCVLLSLV